MFLIVQVLSAPYSFDPKKEEAKKMRGKKGNQLFMRPCFDEFNDPVKHHSKSGKIDTIAMDFRAKERVREGRHGRNSKQ